MTHVFSRAKVAFIAIALLALVAAPSAHALDVGIEYAAEIGLGTSDLRSTIASVISVAMGLLGTIAVVIVLYGGFKWMTAGGEESKVEEAKNLIIQGVIGLAIILSAYAIANFILSTLLKGTGADVTGE